MGGKCLTSLSIFAALYYLLFFHRLAKSIFEEDTSAQTNVLGSMDRFFDAFILLGIYISMISVYLWYEEFLNGLSTVLLSYVFRAS